MSDNLKLMGEKIYHEAGTIVGGKEHTMIHFFHSYFFCVFGRKFQFVEMLFQIRTNYQLYINVVIAANV